MHACPTCQSARVIPNGSAGQSDVAEDGRSPSAMGRHNVLHGHVGYVCFHHPAKHARAESSDNTGHRTPSLLPAPLARTLQTSVDHCLHIQRDGRSHQGPLRQVLDEWELRCASITTYLKLSQFAFRDGMLSLWKSAFFHTPIRRDCHAVL